MKTMRKQSGFTLIELMIVVAILAILMAIAIPAYQDYTIRSQVSEGMNLAGGARTAVAEYWTDKGVYPDSNSQAGLAAATSISGEYVSKVEVQSDGKIHAEFGNKANTNLKAAGSNILALSPFEDGGSVAWSCGTSAGTTVKSKYLPARCRN